MLDRKGGKNGLRRRSNFVWVKRLAFSLIDWNRDVFPVNWFKCIG